MEKHMLNLRWNLFKEVNVMEEKIKNVFAIAGIILGIAFCIFLLNVVESRENEKAKEEGRNTLIYASNGEKYYK